MFQRQHHNDILHALQRLNGDFLSDAACYFGGGTAIVLNLGEYRESVDIDFLCASREGYSKLREAIWGRNDLSAFLLPGSEIKTLRDVQTDQYGIRTIIGVGEAKIKFEIVREARIDLSGSVDQRFGVPVLTRHCMYAEKLLANADRWLDKAVLNRDLIDLAMMISRWGPIPDEAWNLAEEVYGDTVEKSYKSAVECLRNADWLQHCMNEMRIDSKLKDEILSNI